MPDEAKFHPNEFGPCQVARRAITIQYPLQMIWSESIPLALPERGMEGWRDGIEWARERERGQCHVKTWDTVAVLSGNGSLNWAFIPAHHILISTIMRPAEGKHGLLSFGMFYSGEGVLSIIKSNILVFFPMAWNRCGLSGSQWWNQIQTQIHGSKHFSASLLFFSQSHNQIQPCLLANADCPTGDTALLSWATVLVMLD